MQATHNRPGLGLPLACLALVLLLAGRSALEPTGPAAGDPSLRLSATQPSLEVELSGWLLSDPRFSTASATETSTTETSGTGSNGGAGTSGASRPCRVPLQTAAGRSELLFNACPALQQGWRLTVSGRLRRPSSAPHPLLSSAAERLARQGIWSQMQVERWQVLSRPATPIADLRRRIARQLTAVGGPERGGLLAALVLGSAVVPLPADLREAFRVAGLSHALAASGFHLSVLLGAVLPLARRLPRLPRLTLAAGALALFLLLAGPQPSVVRAVLMGGGALLLLESGRRGRPVAILLCTVVAMLLLRPGWLADVGFQLSVGATAGLILTAGPLESWLKGCLGAALPEGWGTGRAATWLAGALAIPLAATAWTLPLQVLHFGVVPLYAVPANLLAAPLLSPLTLGAMALALVAVLLPAVLPVLVQPLLLLAQLLLLICQQISRLPMAQWQTGRPQPVLVLLLALGSLALLLPQLARRWRQLGAALITIAVTLHLAWLAADRMLLVHQGPRDLLVARHGGRAALVSSRSDGLSCHQARSLATGLGIRRYDWLLLLDPVASDGPTCWQDLAQLVQSTGEAGPPLLPGQTLSSEGLEASAVAVDSRALQLRVGRQRWLLLPDRQALWSWERSTPASWPANIWLGFRPSQGDQHSLADGNIERVWWSGNFASRRQTLPPGWRASGLSGSLQTG
ncbi:ComEC/Rec2 family competence protein [Synechococcus sp. CBW1107]|uniref:ComEC/Rec2 family competence protein n=1 Tax=Synechococcus sp. CBW1107 TaxID=2789857 RepID=UPI002AD41016|nr:ComEC/Rec2 family competence protein [Synechococcus sp. CBW1107]CAK6698477.1 hypothetical protein IFHNHDMJ_02439 [Synechococcus sp. CBW1107]